MVLWAVSAQASHCRYSLILLQGPNLALLSAETLHYVDFWTLWKVVWNYLYCIRLHSIARLCDLMTLLRLLQMYESTLSSLYCIMLSTVGQHCWANIELKCLWLFSLANAFGRALYLQYEHYLFLGFFLLCSLRLSVSIQ